MKVRLLLRARCPGGGTVDAVGSGPAAFGCEGSTPSLGTMASWWNGRHAGSKLRCFRRLGSSPSEATQKEGAPMWCPFFSGPAGNRTPVQPTVLDDVYVCSPLFFAWVGRWSGTTPTDSQSRKFRRKKSGHPMQLSTVNDQPSPTVDPWLGWTLRYESGRVVAVVGSSCGLLIRF